MDREKLADITAGFKTANALGREELADLKKINAALIEAHAQLLSQSAYAYVFLVKRLIARGLFAEDDARALRDEITDWAASRPSGDSPGFAAALVQIMKFPGEQSN